MQQNVYLETERLVISSTLVHECAGLQDICNSWCDKMELEGSTFLDLAGFNNVVGIKGDKNYSTDAYARIELTMHLL